MRWAGEARRDREFDGLSTHALARRYGVHRRTVRQALESAVPPERKRPEGRPAPALGPWREWSDQILIADRDAPRKQRHTANRITDRLAEEQGVVVAGSPADVIAHLVPVRNAACSACQTSVNRWIGLDDSPDARPRPANL